MKPSRRLITCSLGLAVASAAATVWAIYPPTARSHVYPGGKRFAFTIVDDTDEARLERVMPLYDEIARAGMRTTKTVWALATASDANPADLGHSLQDRDYRAWVVNLQRRGFEIGLHGVRGGSSDRATTLAGLEAFKEALGRYPQLHVNHSLNRENLYWGHARWWFPPFRIARRALRFPGFEGSLAGSPYFWGDIARERLKYVRRFTYQQTNLLRVNPWMPYRVPGMDHVPLWFDAADGGSLEQFEALLSDANLDRLEREGGVVIVYAHLGGGSFTRAGRAHPQFVARLRAVAAHDGWFAPASEILDFLASQPGWNPDLSTRRLLYLELRFLLDRLF